MIPHPGRKDKDNTMKYAIVTLGCKVKQFETQAMEQNIAYAA